MPTLHQIDFLAKYEVAEPEWLSLFEDKEGPLTSELTKLSKQLGTSVNQ